MLCDGFAHRGLFFEPTLVVQLGAQAVDFLGEFGTFVGHAGVAFAFAFFGVEATAVEFAVAFHVFVLRHGCVVLCVLKLMQLCVVLTFWQEDGSGSSWGERGAMCDSMRNSSRARRQQ
jgi:hypothetical protein